MLILGSYFGLNQFTIDGTRNTVLVLCFFFFKLFRTLVSEIYATKEDVHISELEALFSAMVVNK